MWGFVPEWPPLTCATNKTEAFVAGGCVQVARGVPWLQENDISRVWSQKQLSAPSHGQPVEHAPQRLEEGDFVQEVVVAVGQELAAKREEGRFGEDTETYFYVFLPGGSWTKKRKRTASDGAKCKARNSANNFCELFSLW